MTTTVQKTEKIEDFGQKIGGAKKDVASYYAEKAMLITNETLASQPLSKILPRPDFVKLHTDGKLTADIAIKLRYLYESIPSKPRSYGIARWIQNTMNIIQVIKQGITQGDFPVGYELFTKEDFTNFEKTMKAAGFPQQEFNMHPYKLNYPQPWHMTPEYYVVKGHFIKFRNKEIEPCIDWIRENTGAGSTKKNTRQEFVSRYYTFGGERFITPAGKPRIVLIKGLTKEDALDWIRNRNGELVEKYDKLRKFPFERNDWNRPRTGMDYRNGVDITTEYFASEIPFRGVEFGNWVNQLERAGNLNETFDACFDLANVLGVDIDSITLNRTLAMAFGARGSGNAMAHYEHFSKVINLTRKKGAGSFAHEWFHALDNHLLTLLGHPMLYATDRPELLENKQLSEAIISLTRAFKDSDYYKRSENADLYRSKGYWSTNVELFARAFEIYVVEKLAEDGYYNDYLANVKSKEDYGRNDAYPYPIQSESAIFNPLFNNLFAALYNNQLKVAV